MFRPGGSCGSPIPPTISPRIDWLKYSPESSTVTSGVRNGLSGSVERISWRCGSLGSFTPASFATSGLQAPAAITTVSQAMRPRSVSTARTRPPEMSKPVTVVKVSTRTPRFCAACAYPQRNGQGKMTPSSGL